ncbi:MULTISPECIES: acyl carrier protein [unclassified Crossiella]|uniref:acyl carrier protein n=1 Tax=unclassified Crossiella TaxID=2620835 RepID=UPI001FFFC3C9|nr:MULTISPECIES: acyl carrier protein [unclassified Crossiella]MCK2244365.1 acyl carrier protein [Crossiella sp. S99.2]MCK2257807.1 acyl carrier protein [Crossiella sp. S99.1]
MDRAELIRELHELAARMMRAPRPAVTEDELAEVSLVDRYGFSSLDALEYLLVLEERFDVVFEDEDLTEETLFNIDGLAEYILAQKTGEPSPAPPGR